MSCNEKELRTNELNLLMCKMKLSENGTICFELKNGKREDYISLEDLVSEINQFALRTGTKLHITTT